MKTSKKIRIGFVKFGGLSAGGTEKFLQTIAANLNKDEYEVTYFYCDETSYRGENKRVGKMVPARKRYLEDNDVTVVPFTVKTKDLTTPTHIWRNTNFWNVFDESDFDIIQTGRAGHPEYPFTRIKHTPIVDSIHLTAGVDNQYNIARVMHICQWNAQKWVASGGDKKRIEIVSHPMWIDDATTHDLRDEFDITGDTFVYGFHQRDEDSIFSPLPLQTYKAIETDTTHFMLLGGSQRYQNQAKELGIRNIIFVPHTPDLKRVYSFLKTLNVYAHGRRDGEVNSTAMAEAMYFGLPIVSHRSSVNNGHIECIAEAGVVVGQSDTARYAIELEKLRTDTNYYQMRSRAAKQRFAEKYELNGQMKNIENIYADVIADPFPQPLRRRLYALHWTQNIRLWVKWLYLKLKYLLRGRV